MGPAGQPGPKVTTGSAAAGTGKAGGVRPVVVVRWRFRWYRGHHVRQLGPRSRRRRPASVHSPRPVSVLEPVVASCRHRCRSVPVRAKGRDLGLWSSVDGSWMRTNLIAQKPGLGSGSSCRAQQNPARVTPTAASQTIIPGTRTHSLDSDHITIRPAMAPTSPRYPTRSDQTPSASAGCEPIRHGCPRRELSRGPQSQGAVFRRRPRSITACPGSG